MGFMNARRLTLATLALLCALTGSLALASSSALARETHVFSSSFGSAGSGAGQVSSPAGVAVDSVTHDVYVADEGNFRIDEFSSSGSFLRAWGWGVADGLPAFEACTLSCQPGISGSGAGQFEKPAFVAVDNSGSPSAGDVYVGDTGDEIVSKFDSSGNLASGWGSGGQLNGSTATDGPFGQVAGVAVDGAGTMMVINENDRLFKFGQGGTFGSDFETRYKTAPHGLAVDASGNFFKVDSYGPVEELTGSGSDLGTVSTKPDEPGHTGIAVEPVTGDLYVDQGDHVWQYVFPSTGHVSQQGGSVCTMKPESEFGCAATDSFGLGNLTGGTGIGVDSSDDTVYVADATTERIDVFVKPVIAGVWVSGVTSTSATLNAEVNPLGSSTNYNLEYGTTSSYGQTLTGSVGEGRADVVVSYHRQELLPDTVYHYRIVVHNALGTVESPDHTFTTEPTSGGELSMLDGRAWELVSPANKEGALIEPPAAAFETGEVQAAVGGDAISYVATQSVGENPKGKTFLSQVFSRREAAGWRSENITIPYSLPQEESAAKLFEARAEYRLFSSDLSQAVVEPHSALFSPSEEAKERTLFLRDDANGAYVPLVNEDNVPPDTKYGGRGGNEGRGGSLHFIAATPDLSHVLIESAEALTPEAREGCPQDNCGGTIPANLYEWIAGRLQLVNVLPNGETEAGFYFPANSRIGGLTVHALSSDGRRVVWQSKALGEALGTFYVRDMVDERTVQVSGPNSPSFQTMSGDGSRIFYLEEGDLYVFDVDNGTRTDLTANHGAGEGSGGVKEAVLGASEDGSYVYFVATGVFASDAVGGQDNLYVSHDNGSEWMTTRIATLSSEDEKSWFTEATLQLKTVDLSHVSSRVSPNGRYLAFMSNRSLTGYDNMDAVSGQPDEEVYLYDVVARRLTCASCDPTGARPVGVDDIFSETVGGALVDRLVSWTHHWLAGSIPGWDEAGGSVVYQPRYLSDSGRLFFNSPDALAPQDTNGLEDVYEYEPAGVGGCASTSVTFGVRSGGCVNLISSGTSSGESAFVDASENGDDAFFVTSSRLTAADYDTSYDMYDAHVCSALVPCVASPVSAPPCTSGDSCKAAPSPQPEIFGPAPSATFSGTGNVVSPSGGVVTPKALTRAQRLAKALTVCRKEKGKRKRVACERQARKRYPAGQARKAKATTKGHR